MVRDIDKMYGILRKLGNKPMVCLLGPKQFAELKMQVPPTMPFSFHEPKAFRRGSPDTFQYIGLTVECVPWLDGVVLLEEAPRSSNTATKRRLSSTSMPSNHWRFSSSSAV